MRVRPESIPGQKLHSDREVQVVQNIYQMHENDSVSQGIPYLDGSRCTYQNVAEILTNPKYAGFHAYGRTSSRLSTPPVKRPKSDWILRPGAFEPIVEHETFLKAQQVLSFRTTNLPNKELLARLKLLLSREGRLSLKLIKNSPQLPSPSSYRQRFGSLRTAYQMIGYGNPEHFGPIDLRRRTQALREDLITRILQTFPDDVSLACVGGRWRKRLRLRHGMFLSVLIARSVRVWKDTARWVIDPLEHERHYVTLLTRLDLANGSFLDFHVLPNIDRSTRFQISREDPWLLREVPLDGVSGLLCGVQRVTVRVQQSTQHGIVAGH